jgi:hypothetical protein
MAHEWSAEPANLLSPEVISRLTDALADGIVCGIHAFYGGGRGPEPCAFLDLPSYLSTVNESRPGDWFTLWSVPELGRRNALLLRKQATPATQSELDQIRDWLSVDPMREYLAVGCTEQRELPKACWGDHDWFDHLEELALRYAPHGEFAVLPLTELVGDTRKWTPRLHFIDAKRPNDKGEVPLRGAY